MNCKHNQVLSPTESERISKPYLPDVNLLELSERTEVSSSFIAVKAAKPTDESVSKICPNPHDSESNLTKRDVCIVETSPFRPQVLAHPGPDPSLSFDSFVFRPFAVEASNEDDCFLILVDESESCVEFVPLGLLPTRMKGGKSR